MFSINTYRKKISFFSMLFQKNVERKVVFSPHFLTLIFAVEKKLKFISIFKNFKCMC